MPKPVRNNTAGRNLSASTPESPKKGASVKSRLLYKKAGKASDQATSESIENRLRERHNLAIVSGTGARDMRARLINSNFQNRLLFQPPKG